MTTLADLTATTPGLPCRTTDPEIFFSSRPNDRALAVALCQECPLRRPCAQYAIDNPVIGVWGGSAVSPTVRMRLRGQPWRFDDQGRVRMLCGSEDAYRSHMGYREQPCAECVAAHEEHITAQRRARLEQEHAAGGSTVGFWLHRRLGEPPCRECHGAFLAQQAVNRQARARRGRGRARAASVTSGPAGALHGAPAGAQPLALAG